MNIFRLFIVSVLCFVFSCNFNDTLAPEQETQNHPTILKQDKNIKLVPFTKERRLQMNKVVEVSDYVTFAEGGELELNYDEDIDIEVSFKIPKYSINQDATLILNIDTDNFVGTFDVNFYPHGITFSNDAILNVEAEDLDLTGIDPNSVKIYYDNSETGAWEEMTCDSIIVKVNEGKINVINAQIPHFSRYAIGTE